MAKIGETDWQRFWGPPYAPPVFGAAYPDRRLIGFALFTTRTNTSLPSGYFGFRYIGKLSDTNNPVMAEVAADENLNSTQSLPGNFSVATGTAGIGTYTPSHPQKGGLPKGCDILFLDSHVGWRKFVNNLSGAVTSGAMLPRYQAPSSSAPYYFF
jgi:hypothetical protein